MKLNDFITGVLLDIENGLNKANETTGKYFTVVSQTGKDVMFDIAVTASDESSTKAEGGLNFGIDVFGAKIGGKKDCKQENTQVSRIQFCVNFPHKTQQESQEEAARFYQRHEENAKYRFGLD